MSTTLPPLGEIPKVQWNLIEGNLLERLGVGATSAVFRGVWEGQEVAVKILDNIPGMSLF